MERVTVCQAVATSNVGLADFGASNGLSDRYTDSSADFGTSNGLSDRYTDFSADFGASNGLADRYTDTSADFGISNVLSDRYTAHSAKFDAGPLLLVLRKIDILDNPAFARIDLVAH